MVSMGDAFTFPARTDPKRSRDPDTLILTRSDIASVMQPVDWMEPVEAGFAALAEGRAHLPPALHLPLEAGAVHAKAAALPDARLAAIKLNANAPGNPVRFGLPTIQGALALFDLEDGRLLALMDSIELTLRRTAAASAIAAKRLAKPDAERLAMIGCGAQALPQLEAICAALPVRKVRAWDRDAAKAEVFARAAGGKGIDARPARSLEDAVAGAEIIVTCTTSREPFLEPRHVSPGAFVAAVGADNADKAEISPALMTASRVVGDVLDQCLEIGDLRSAIAAGAMKPGDVHATLAEVITGRKPGRTDARQVFVFDSTGTGVQDAAAAAVVYARAVTSGVGRSVRLQA
jgi:ornithine cyclodeaminase/alanine dehydrogenase-like protein (mu-crystallin family)